MFVTETPGRGWAGDALVPTKNLHNLVFQINYKI